MQSDALAPGARVLIIDDVLATGGTLEAAAQLVKGSGGHIGGLAAIVELGGLGGRGRLTPHEVFCVHDVT